MDLGPIAIFLPYSVGVLIERTPLPFRCNLAHFEEKSLLSAHIIKGLYAIQLERWFTLFGKENVKVRVSSGVYSWRNSDVFPDRRDSKYPIGDFQRRTTASLSPTYSLLVKGLNAPLILSRRALHARGHGWAEQLRIM